MGKKNHGKKERENGHVKGVKKEPWFSGIHPETKKATLAVVMFVAAVLLALSFIGKGGRLGSTIYTTLDFLLGRGYFFAPLSLVLMAFSTLFSEQRKIIATTILGGFLFLIASLSFLHIMLGEGAGGLIGKLSGGSAESLFDFWGGLVLTLGIFSISVLLMLNMPFWIRNETEALDGDDDDDVEEEEEPSKEGGPAGESVEKMLSVINNIKSAFEKKQEEKASVSVQEQDSAAAASSVAAIKEEPLLEMKKVVRKMGYKKPPLELLQGDRGKPSSGDIKANANIIKRTLETFGVDVEMGEVSIGPTVTQYTLKPAEGVKLSRITALHNDLSLALAAHPIRIEAPIPGKSLVGIEVPNRSIALVGLRALLENKTYQDASGALVFALGRDVTGLPIFADLAKMPHLLISGATGSGKSVSVHSIMTSFLYRNPPEILKFIIVDPKRVELSIYNDIPHLLTPVITDPKKTIQSLRWATKEMDRRYDVLSVSHTRDITSYNSQVAKSGEGELLPYIVIMIDELADLMMTFPREVEASIIRLAQMARAVGIHLIVATQRPSVEVITGLIKANITSRIAFQVASQIDSRTILDAPGAEKLLGNGDMLFVAGDSGKPKRIQGGFVSEQEVKKIVDFLRNECEAPEFNENIMETKLEEDGGMGEDLDEDDPMYEEAKSLVLDAGKASASYLQRRLRVGYARAARLLDLMEARGVVGPADGAKPREVLVRTADVREGDEI